MMNGFVVDVRGMLNLMDSAYMKRRVTRLQLTQILTAWASDFYLGGMKEFIAEISEDGQRFTVEPSKRNANHQKG